MNIISKSLAQLAQEVPGITAVFSQFGLSYCWNGSQTLKQAIENTGLKKNDVLEAIAQLTVTPDRMNDWKKMDNNELITHLTDRYHHVHRVQLEELFRLASRVESVHHEHLKCPIGLANHLKHFFIELEKHMLNEETVLFPQLMQDPLSVTSDHIVAMRQEHKLCLEAINKIDDITEGVITPKGACNTWTALYLGLSTFKDDLASHIQLENEILYRGKIS
ncbi:DUF542 domain-containing protein [Neptunomonas sp.]|uniref:DUF542 domain-containing protein n=1 Tax=Neptunomonas sp. TaxID=1971898 RepID=UPI0035644E31